MYYSRPVRPSDIQGVEKKLMQTLDMTLVKKRRLALSSRETEKTNGGFWSILTRSNSKY